MGKALIAVLAFLVAVTLIVYLLTIPRTISASALPARTPDLANGKYMFAAGGCAECHAAPVKGCGDLTTKDKETFAGGRCLRTPFGLFHAPNISPDKEAGIGNWSTLDFVNAMKRGIAPAPISIPPFPIRPISA